MVHTLLSTDYFCIIYSYQFHAQMYHRGVRSLWIVGGQGMKINGIWSKVDGQIMKFSTVLAKKWVGKCPSCPPPQLWCPCTRLRIYLYCNILRVQVPLSAILSGCACLLQITFVLLLLFCSHNLLLHWSFAIAFFWNINMHPFKS